MSKLDELISRLCPNGVQYKNLDSLCTIKGRIGFRGYTRNDLVNEGEGPITLSPSNIVNGDLSFEDCSFISWFKYNESPEIKVSIGDILFCKTASVGKTALVKHLPCKATINPQFLLLKDCKCDSSFLSYYLKTDVFQKQIQRICGLGTIPTFSQKDFAEIEIPVPPLEVQREIVRILDNFTELTTKLTTELTARRKQYEYYRDFLFKNVKDAKAKSIGSFSKLCAGATPSTSKAEYWEKGDIPWMSSGEVNLGEVFDTEKRITQVGYNNSSTKMLPVNTVVIALAGQGKTRGSVAITRIELCTNQSICGIITDKTVNPEYLRYYLQTQYMKLRDISAGDGTRGGLNLKMISEFEIPVPPINEQNRIVNDLKVLDKYCTNMFSGLPAEIEARQKQYEYYRDKLLSFKEFEP